MIFKSRSKKICSNVSDNLDCTKLFTLINAIRLQVSNLTQMYSAQNLLAIEAADSNHLLCQILFHHPLLRGLCYLLIIILLSQFVLHFIEFLLCTDH